MAHHLLADGAQELVVPLWGCPPLENDTSDILTSKRSVLRGLPLKMKAILFPVLKYIHGWHMLRLTQ